MGSYIADDRRVEFGKRNLENMGGVNAPKSVRVLGNDCYLYSTWTLEAVRAV